MAKPKNLLTRIGVGEYLAQIFGGIPMSQGEFVRLGDFGLASDAIAESRIAAIDELIATGNTVANRARLVELVDHAEASATVGAPGPRRNAGSDPRGNPQISRKRKSCRTPMNGI